MAKTECQNTHSTGKRPNARRWRPARAWKPASGFFAGFAAITLGTSASAAVVLPSGTAYQPPSSGTLVLDEVYGSNHDGQGSWSSFIDPNITVNPESISVVVDVNPGSGADYRALVALPFDIHSTSYVIDIGLEFWTADDDLTNERSLIIIPASTSGTKYGYYAYPTGPAPGATLRGNPTGTHIGFDRDTAQVIRMTATAGNDPEPENYAVVSTNPATTTSIKEISSGVDGLFLTGGPEFPNQHPGPTTLEVSWMKIYTGVLDNAPPLIVTALDGDLDGDGFVGIDDLNLVLGNWNQNVPPGDPLADPSGDGFVGIDDLNTVLGNWNAGTPPAPGATIPEPATLTLLSIGGMTVLRRR